MTSLALKAFVPLFSDRVGQFQESLSDRPVPIVPSLHL
jgi:hypothetical protein